MLGRYLECAARRRPDSFVALTRLIIMMMMMMMIVMMMVVLSFVYFVKRGSLDVNVKRCKV